MNAWLPAPGTVFFGVDRSVQSARFTQPRPWTKREKRQAARIRRRERNRR